MEHLHHQRRSFVLLLIAVASTFGVACGSESTGDGTGLPRTERDFGGDPVGAADLGGGNDPGTGIVPEKLPVFCTSDAQCAGGFCTGDSRGVGVCIRVCAAAPDFARPGVSVMRCLSGDECIMINDASSGISDVGVCLRRCTSNADCPDLGSRFLISTCQINQPGQSFCVAGDSVKSE